MSIGASSRKVGSGIHQKNVQLCLQQDNGQLAPWTVRLHFCPLISLPSYLPTCMPAGLLPYPSTIDVICLTFYVQNLHIGKQYAVYRVYVPHLFKYTVYIYIQMCVCMCFYLYICLYLGLFFLSSIAIYLYIYNLYIVLGRC